MWIKTKKNILLIVLTLLLSSFILAACGNSANMMKSKDDQNQQDVNILFEKAQNLFDADKYEDTYKIFKQLADQGDAKALNALGKGYQQGFWGETDLKKACEYYEKSAILDYGLGAANTANCYYEGWGGIKDKHKYFNYSLKAAEKNYALSQFNVAVMYKKGEVVDKSIEKSVYWYKKAIENSEPRAAYNLASLYEKGDGVKQDFDLAYAYYTLAKEFGLDVAQKKLVELDSKVVKENIRILKNGDSIQIAVDDPSGKWEIMDEEDYLKNKR